MTGLFDYLDAPDPLEAAFREFDAANPRVWRLFCDVVRDVQGAGYTHYSADAVVHIIRWETTVKTKSADGFKINDHHVTFYARRWLDEHPGSEFFRLRARSRWASTPPQISPPRVVRSGSEQG